jgi:hypothetical protein
MVPLMYYQRSINLNDNEILLCTPIRKAKLKHIDNSQCWRGYKTPGTLIHCWWECKMVATLEDSLMVSYKTK